MAVLARASLDERVAIADINFDEEAEPDQREVVVTFLANDTPEARRVIKRWARTICHGTLWFEDEVEWIDQERPDPDRAVARCSSCGLEMSDGGEKFWDFIREAGFFPPFCFICGASVPQWLPKRKKAPQEAREPSPRMKRVQATMRLHRELEPRNDSE